MNTWKAQELIKTIARLSTLEETEVYKPDGTSYENAEMLDDHAATLDLMIRLARQILSE